MKTLTAALILLAAGLGSVTAAETVSDRFAPRSMAYVLQADAFEHDRARAVQRLAGSDRDLVVLDATFGTGPGAAWTSMELETIRRGKAGRRVVAYLSVGEAEDYRDYWHLEWGKGGRLTTNAPAFLVGENPEWKGNYKVKYWQAEWQQIILSQVESIATRGFDGLYLDIVDGFETFEADHGKYLDHRPNPETHRTYRQDMIDWVGRIAARARATRKNFLIIPQNGSQLLEEPEFAALIDAIGIEDLFTNGNKPQPKAHSTEVLDSLKMLKEKPVLLIEYPQKPALKQSSISKAAANGLILLITDRQLKTLGEAVPR